MHARGDIKDRAPADFFVVGQIAVERTDVFAAEAAVVETIVIAQRRVKHVFRYVWHRFARRWQRMSAVAHNVVFLFGMGVGIRGVVVEVVRQLTAPLQLQTFTLHAADVHHFVVTIRIGGRNLPVGIAHIEQRRAQQHIFALKTPAQLMVPAQLRFGADRIADVVEHVVGWCTHVARQVIEQLIFTIRLIADAKVRQEFMVGRLAFFRSAIQAAFIIAFTFNILISQPAHQRPVRRHEPAVLKPYFVRRSHRVLVTPLYRIAVRIFNLIGTARFAGNVRRVAIVLNANKRLGLRLTRALVPVANIQAVFVVNIPLQFRSNARPPGLGPRRPVVGIGSQVAEIVLSGGIRRIGQHRGRLSGKAAAVTPVVIGLNGQREVIAQL